MPFVLRSAIYFSLCACGLWTLGQATGTDDSSREQFAQLAESLRTKTLSHSEWFKQELARASMGRAEVKICLDAIRDLKSEHHKLVAVEEACKAASVSLDESSLKAMIADLRSCRVEPAGWDPNESYVLSRLVTHLCLNGRGKVALSLTDREGAIESPALYLIRGDIDGALANVRKSSGKPVRSEGVLIASQAYRAGASKSAIEFLQKGWTSEAEHWSRDLCLDLSMHGLEVEHLVTLCPKEVRRLALGRACAKMLTFPKEYNESLGDKESSRLLELMAQTDLLAAGRCCEGYREQGDREASMRLVALAMDRIREQSIRDKLRHPRLREHNESAVLKEVMRTRLRFGQHELLAKDVDALAGVLGDESIFGCLTEAVACERKRGTEIRIGDLVEVMSSPELQLACRLGYFDGEVRMPDRINSVRAILQTQLRASLIERLTDELYE